MVLGFLFLSLNVLAEDDFDTTSYNKTLGASVYGSIQLVDTLPLVDMGIGGGAFFDWRFNERFSLMVESFFTTQDGRGQSAADRSIEFLCIPASTFKVYIPTKTPQLDPYIGLGIGFYHLREGDVEDDTAGFGIGAQIEVGIEYLLADNLMVGVGGTYRSVGLINSLTGPANASTYMPYTLFGRVGYRF